MTRSKTFLPFPSSILIGAALLFTLAGCADYPSWGGSSTQPTVAQLQRGRGIQADWVYYPSYRTYYSSNYQEFVFWDVTDWVTRTELVAPLTLEKLRASPSVGMNFQDSPVAHHAAVEQLYPRGWRRQQGGFVVTRSD